MDSGKEPATGTTCQWMTRDFDPNSINNLYLDTECGINRVAIRSSLTPGTITLTAKRDGLTPATIEIKSSPMEITDGLTMEFPQQLPGPVAQVSATR